MADQFKTIFEGEDKLSQTISKVSHGLRGLKRDYGEVRKSIKEISEVGRFAQAAGVTSLSGLAGIGGIRGSEKKQYSEVASEVGNAAGLVAGMVTAPLVGKAIDSFLSNFTNTIEDKIGDAISDTLGKTTSNVSSKVASKITSKVIPRFTNKDTGSITLGSKDGKFTSRGTMAALVPLSGRKVVAGVAAKKLGETFGIALAKRAVGSLVPIVGQILVVSTIIETVSNGVAAMVDDIQSTLSPKFGGRNLNAYMEERATQKSIQKQKINPLDLSKQRLTIRKGNQVSVNGMEAGAYYRANSIDSPDKRYGSSYLSDLLFYRRQAQFIQQANEELGIRNMERKDALRALTRE